MTIGPDMQKDFACKDCRFAEQIDDTSWYICHRFAPSPKIIDEREIGDMMVCWPLVLSDDWCGEWYVRQERIDINTGDTTWQTSQG